MNEAEARALSAVRAIEAPLEVAKALSYRIRDSDKPLECRLREAEFLKRLLELLASTLRLLIEAEQHDLLRRSLQEVRGLWEFWDPESDLRDLQLENEFNENPDRDSVIDALLPIARAAGGVRRQRLRTIFELGAWLAMEIRGDPEHPSRDDREVDLRLLADAIESPSQLIELVTETPAGARTQFPLLDSFWMERASAQGQNSVVGTWSEHGYYWAAILLLRLVRPGYELEIEPESGVGALRDALLQQIDRAVADREIWGEVLPEDIEEHALFLRERLDAAQAEFERRQAEAVAQADLDEAIIAEFRAANQSSLRGAQRLASLFRTAGRLAREEDPEALGDESRGIDQVMPRRFFIAEVGASAAGIDEFGAELGRDQDAMVLEWLEAGATEVIWEAGPVEALRVLIGEEPMTDPRVLAADRPSLRRYLHGADGFERDAQDGPLTFGRLDGVPVHLLAAGEGPLLFVDFERVSLLERVRPGMTSPLYLAVADFDHDRAAELVDRGFHFADQPELDRERMIAELRDQRVRVNARLEYRLDIHEPATIRRISLDRMDSPG